ncbi:MAG: two-component system sensor histidine kinase NtrB [Thermodesulfobacteriota bacterium]
MFSSICPHAGSPAANEHLKKQIRWLLFLRVLFLSLILGISVLLQPKNQPFLLPSRHLLAWFIAGLYLFSIASALALRVIQCYRRFGYLQIGVDTVLVTLLVLVSGGSQSVFTVAFFLPIVMGAAMLFQRGGTFFAAASTLLYGGLLVVEYNGLAPRILSRVDSPLVSLEVVLHFFAIHGITFFVVGLLASLVSARLQRTEAALFQTTSDLDRLSSLYRRIFEDVSTGIITTDSDHRITSFNPAAERITGYHAEHAVGLGITQLLPDLTPVAEEGERLSASIRRSNGVLIPVGYSWSRLRDEDGSANQQVCTIQDLSQLKKMEAKVRQAEKMATIGEMAAGIAHELRNPLAAISGAAQMLDKETETHPINQRLFRIIVRESDRLDATIHEFLLFARPVAPERKWFNLAEVAKDALETLRQGSAWNSSLRIEFNEGPQFDCWGDPNLFRQVFINLLANSAAAGAGRVSLFTVPPHQGNTQESLVFTVCDDGPGIPEQALPRLFDPFFTTRESGTGLGLAIVLQIIEGHDGWISASNDAAGGACFTISIPRPNRVPPDGA